MLQNLSTWEQHQQVKNDVHDKIRKKRNSRDVYYSVQKLLSYTYSPKHLRSICIKQFCQLFYINVKCELLLWWKNIIRSIWKQNGQDKVGEQFRVLYMKELCDL
jgi:hypothetical protein